MPTGRWKCEKRKGQLLDYFLRPFVKARKAQELLLVVLPSMQMLGSIFSVKHHTCAKYEREHVKLLPAREENVKPTIKEHLSRQK